MRNICIYVSTTCEWDAEEDAGFPGSGGLWTTRWVLRTEPGSAGRLNHHLSCPQNAYFIHVYLYFFYFYLYLFSCTFPYSIYMFVLSFSCFFEFSLLFLVIYYFKILNFYIFSYYFWIWNLKFLKFFHSM